VDTYAHVTNAILLLGHHPDRYGKISEGAKIRVDMAAHLYRQGVAPVVISSGWYWPKDPHLMRYREAEIMRDYLHDAHGKDIPVVCEPYSTSVQENLLFTRVMFAHLKQLTIVSGELFVERTRFLAGMTFGDRVRITHRTCPDDLSDEANQRRILKNVQCILKGMTPGDIAFLLLPSLPDGTLRSRWPELYASHGKTCRLHH